MPGDVPDSAATRLLTQPLYSFVAPNLQVWPLDSGQTHISLPKIYLAGKTQAQSLIVVVISKISIAWHKNLEFTFTFISNPMCLAVDKRASKASKQTEVPSKSVVTCKKRVAPLLRGEMDWPGGQTIQDRRNHRQRWICWADSGQANNPTWPMAVASKPV